jgi:hypothetical protein
MKYTLVIIDGSFLLTRALYAITRGKNPLEVKPGELMKVNLQTINRLARDWDISGSKVMIIWDKWSEKYGGYIRHHILRDHLKYKSSRVIVTEEDLKGLTGEELRKAERELSLNNLKMETKAAMIKEFPKLGIPCYYYPGYEFDDIATLVSFEYSGKTENPNVIVTKDTDLTYSLSPGCHFFKLPTYGSEPKTITYEDMLQTIPAELKKRGVGLYQFGAMLNSSGFLGHNDLIVTKKKGAKMEETLLGILDGNYSGIKDPELYALQYSTYNISAFPDYSAVLEDVHGFLSCGSPGSADEFERVAKEYEIEGIDRMYYLKIITRFDEKYFSV